MQMTKADWRVWFQERRRAARLGAAWRCPACETDCRCKGCGRPCFGPCMMRTPSGEPYPHRYETGAI
jgi:hypothetical protein